MSPSRKKKPSIKDLQKFTNMYFKNPPIVKWRKMKEYGLALCGKKIIYINPDQDLKTYKATDYVRDITPYLSEGEQYFVTLLHEIGHFKLGYPKHWIKLREKIIKEYPNDEEKQVSRILDYLKKKHNENNEDHRKRLNKFEIFLLAGRDYGEKNKIFYEMPETEDILYAGNEAYRDIVELDVCSWSQEEFLRKWKTIRKILGIKKQPPHIIQCAKNIY